jgi:hypothetical protein
MSVQYWQCKQREQEKPWPSAYEDGGTIEEDGGTIEEDGGEVLAATPPLDGSDQSSRPQQSWPLLPLQHWNMRQQLRV